jgi:signal transduction histidine kinase
MSGSGPFAALWQRAADRVRRIPLDAPQDKRNALMLETVLFIAGAAALSMAVVSHVASGGSGSADSVGALAICVYTWSCVFLSRRGFFRLAASLAVVGGMSLICLSYANYGLQAQSGLQMTHLMPFLFAGLLLGRAAVWWTALANAFALALGAWIDLGQATNAATTSAVLPNLSLSAMNFLILAVILDRLILSSQQAIQRSEDLEVEIEHKERAFARLLQTQRMEAVGRLSAGVAHDFNNILSVILGLATSSRRDGPVEATLANIGQAARRGAVVTRRLLSFSRIQIHQVSTFDLASAIDEAWTLVLPMLGRSIEARLDIPHPGPLISVDRDELELSLLNIVGNACDAMPDGGSFALSVGSSDGHAVISIEDTGTGMTPEVLARLFEPFFTTKSKGKGTGIGMAIVNRFVTDSGGTLEVDSAPGQGTRIRIRLPLAAQEDAVLPDPGVGARRVLLVTDDARLSRLATTTLAGHGTYLLKAGTADEAISVALQSVSIDVVIADHALPGANASGLLRKIGTMLPDARLAMLTDASATPAAVPGIECLHKPLDGERLLALLHATGADQATSAAAGDAGA